MNNNLIFQLECGPINDRRILNMELPVNYISGRSILVSYTGGVDSAFLLYLLAKLNDTQRIPYIIQPVVINNRLGSADDANNKYSCPITESIARIPNTIRYFQKTFTNSQIQNCIRSTADPTKPHSIQIRTCVKSVYNNGKYYLIYSGVNENPTSDECSGGAVRPDVDSFDQKKSHPWRLPFINLKKTHIMDAIIQMNAFEILELCTKCTHHTSLDDTCEAFNCRERWWALNTLDRSDLIVKYFLNEN